MNNNILKNDLKRMRDSAHHDICEGIIGADFAKRSDNVKWGMMFQPKTRAEETINWFLYGKKYQSAPQHFNCRCSTKQVKHEH